MLNKLFTKDINSICDLRDIKDNGQIISNGETYQIYKVYPINIITGKPIDERDIYDIYLSCIRYISDDIKIFITTKKDSFNGEIELYKKKLLEIENDGLKMAMKKYIDYLEELNNKSETYNANYYIISQVKGNSKDMSYIFSELKRFGLLIEKITSKAKAEAIFKEAAK